MRTLYLLSALPGSGKSTWAKRFKNEHPTAKIVSSDNLRVELLGRVDDFTNEKLVWASFLDRIHEYAKDENAIVIADSTNILNSYRAYYLEQTPEFDRHVLVMFDIPLPIVFAQNKLRGGDRVVPDEAMKRMTDQFEKPTQEVIKAYDEVIHVGPDFIAEELKRQNREDLIVPELLK